MVTADNLFSLTETDLPFSQVSLEGAQDGIDEYIRDSNL